MFKTVTVHVHNPTREEYDAIPIPEEGTDDGTLLWKACGNVTVFAPRYDSETTTCSLEYKAYGAGEDFDLDIRRKNAVAL